MKRLGNRFSFGPRSGSGDDALVVARCTVQQHRVRPPATARRRRHIGFALLNCPLPSAHYHLPTTIYPLSTVFPQSGKDSASPFLCLPWFISNSLRIFNELFVRIFTHMYATMTSFSAWCVLKQRWNVFMGLIISCVAIC